MPSSAIARLCLLLMLSAAQPFAAAQEAMLSDEATRGAMIEALPETLPAIVGEVPLERFRRSFWQGAELRGGYLGELSSEAGAIDQTHWEARVGFAVPLGSLENLLVVSPAFRTDFLNGPDTIDVPESLHNAGVTFLHRYQWTPRLSTMILATPSVRSDFTTSDGAFRWFGLGVVNWDAVPNRWQWTAGVVFLDRADVGVVPALGLTWTPNPAWRLELVAPRPRLAYRLWKDGPREERWVYTAATLGGNTWAVTRANGQTDELTLRDWRLLVGYEILRPGNRGLTVELGWAFDRSLEYERAGIESPLDQALFAELGWRF